MNFPLTLPAVQHALAKRLATAGRSDLLDFFDIYSSRVRNFNANQPSIYWMQDLAIDHEAQHLTDDRYLFSAIVFVSHWQQQQFQRRYAMARQKQVVLPNAITLFEPNVLGKWSQPQLGSKENPIRLIYHTTPHRGLELLVPAYDHVCKILTAQGIHLHLDVYSSFSIYGWQQRDEPYLELFDTCRQHPLITYHGAVSNPQVREALHRAHLFVYPSIWPETSCIALIEAMAAGCVCVHSNLAALPETAGGMTVCYPFVPDAIPHAQTFANTLQGVLLNLAAGINRGQRPAMALNAMQRANAIYNWDSRIHEWIGLLNSIKNRLIS
jgi:UDP-glucose:(glucosyl)LPS alpha-1,2-glucosyltransferase